MEGQTLGKYEIRSTLGRGAMGTVYEGWDPIIHRRVAIKTVRLPEASDLDAQEELARFKREAQAAGRLHHPNVVGVFDYGETAEIAYIVMEFVDGRTLKSVVDGDERLPIPAVTGIMEGLLSGLQYSHERGVIHRDIKPANLIISRDGPAKIADFGIARIESSNMTQAGTIMGTPAYMSPEQFMGQTVDLRTDIYSSGVLLFQMLTGERPFEGSMATIMHKALNVVPPKPSDLSVTAPMALDAVVARAMARRPEERYASAAAFMEAFHAALKAPAGLGPGLGDLDGGDATVISAPGGTAAKGAGGPRAGTPPGQQAAQKAGQASTGSSRLPLLAGAAVLALAAGGSGAWWALRPAQTTPVPPDPRVEQTGQAGGTGQTTGQTNTGQTNTGQTNTGQTAGQTTPDQTAGGPNATGQASSGQPANGQSPNGQTTASQTAGRTPPDATVPDAPPPQTSPPNTSPRNQAGTVPGSQPPLPQTPVSQPPVLQPPVRTEGTSPPERVTELPPQPDPPRRQPNPGTGATSDPAPPVQNAARQPPIVTGPVIIEPRQPVVVEPPPPPVAAILTPEALRRAVAAAAGGIDCAVVTGDVAQTTGVVELRGVVGAGGPEAQLQREVRDAAGAATVDFAVGAAVGPYCPVLNMLRPYVRPFGNPGGPALGMADNQTNLYEGGLVRAFVIMPERGYLQIDYFSSDGTVLHMQQSLQTPRGPFAGRSLQRAGDPSGSFQGWKTLPPFGTDVVTAITSPVPLFRAERPEGEQTADYLRDLRTALEAARRGGERPGASVLLVHTAPKPP